MMGVFDKSAMNDRQSNVVCVDPDLADSCAHNSPGAFMKKTYPPQRTTSVASGATLAMIFLNSSTISCTSAGVCSRNFSTWRTGSVFINLDWSYQNKYFPRKLHQI
jgi:hypothetical protein